MSASVANFAAKAVGASDAVRAVTNHLPEMPVNVGENERLVTAAAGAALVGWAISGKNTSWLALAGGAALLYRAASGHCAAYQAFGINTAGEHGSATVIPAGEGVKVEYAVTVRKPADEVYRFWRQFENLPRFMNNLTEVRNLSADGRRSHWVAKGPLGTKVEWDAEVIVDRMNERIAWKSLPGADADNTGSVEFRQLPAGQGTEVRVALKYDPPAGKVGATVAKWLGRDPETEIREDLARFQQLMEGNYTPATARR